MLSRLFEKKVKDNLVLTTTHAHAREQKFPEQWSVTLPYVVGMSLRAADSISLRATALSTISLLCAVALDSWQACSDKERALVRRAITELSLFLPPLPGTASSPVLLLTSSFFTLNRDLFFFFFFFSFDGRCGGVSARSGGESGQQAQ